MKSIKTLLLFVFAIVLTACGDGLSKKVITSYDNGQPSKARFYNRENQCVREVEYYENGLVYIEGAIKDDLRDGEWISYFPDGKVQSKGFFEQGLRTGKALVYYENGNLWMEGYYSHDHKCGEWIHYDEQGYEILRVDCGDCD